MKRKNRKWSKKNLNEQLQAFFSFMILVLMVLMLLISTVSAMSSLYRKSEEQAFSQLKFMESSYLSWMESAYAMIQALEMETSVQAFCNLTETGGMVYQELYKDTKEFMDDYLYVDGDVNFIIVTNDKTGSAIFSGKQSKVFHRLEQVYERNYENSRRARVRGTLRLNYGKDYHQGKKSTVTIYQPIYSVTRIDEQIGMACINLNDSLAEGLNQQQNVEFCMTDLEGGVIFTTKTGERKKGEQLFDAPEDASGSVRRNGNYLFYQRIPGWNFYVVSVVPVYNLYKSSLVVVLLMAGVTAVLLLAGLHMIRGMIDRSYQPLRTVIDAMDMVAEHKLDFRIDTEDMGADFEKLGNGYNEMMDNVEKLMEEVRREQQHVDQIRLNMLQSQIQPHFLYNTLECIHWQARADGSRETSEMVMALARYYRICLSQGKELIPLSQELEHIRCYLLIQNMRYGSNITYQMQVPEELKDIMIPKMTLQPLVENSVYHGIRIKEGGSGTVNIYGEQRGEDVLIRVEDNGQGMGEEQIREMNESISDYSREFGYGVRNVNKRIELTFGPGYGLRYQNNTQEGHGITVEILLPKKYESQPDLIFHDR